MTAKNLENQAWETADPFHSVASVAAAFAAAERKNTASALVSTAPGVPAAFGPFAFGTAAATRHPL